MPNQDESRVSKMSWSMVSKAAETSSRQRQESFCEPVAVRKLNVSRPVDAIGGDIVRTSISVAGWQQWRRLVGHRRVDGRGTVMMYASLPTGFNLGTDDASVQRGNHGNDVNKQYC